MKWNQTGLIAVMVWVMLLSGCGDGDTQPAESNVSILNGGKTFSVSHKTVPFDKNTKLPYIGYQTLFDNPEATEQTYQENLIPYGGVKTSYGEPYNVSKCARGTLLWPGNHPAERII